MKTWTPAATVKQTTCLCRDTGGKGTLPAQHTTFNTLDNWAIKTPPNQKGKGPERKGYRVMAQNMYTIHSVTHPKPDLCALTRCVFADQRSDTDHVGSHYIQTRFVCLDSVCVCWSAFRYWSRGEPLHPNQICVPWLGVCLLISVQILITWGAITSKPDLCALTRCVFADQRSDTDHVGSHYIQTRFVCLDSVCVCWSAFRYWSRGEPLHPNQICVPWLGVCLLISVQILITWGAITSKARFVCLDSVCVCWSAFRYWSRGEPLHPKPDLCALTRCVFADPCSDTDHVGSHYIQTRFVCLDSVCVCWSAFRYLLCWELLFPKPALPSLTQRVCLLIHV